MTIRDLVPAWNKNSLPAKRRELQHPLLQVQNEVNSLFDSFFDSWRPARFEFDTMNTFPQIDISESDKAVLIEAELPGLDEKDIDISLSGNIVKLQGEKRQEREEKKRNSYYMERSYGQFCREIPLGCEIEESSVKATFKKGVLKIKLPKTPQAQQLSKSIPISIS